MMPKGVEHDVCGLHNDAAIIVSNSVMPKGVEHGLNWSVPPSAMACRIQ